MTDTTTEALPADEQATIPGVETEPAPPPPATPDRVEIQLLNGITHNGEFIEDVVLTGDEKIYQDQLGVTVRYPGGNVLWIPTANIAAITTEPQV